MAHIKGPPRVAIVISFVSRPFTENKLLPLAAGYVIPWNTMGFNFEDLEKAPTTMVPPWSTLRSLGLTKIFDSKNDRQNAGWDYFGFCESHMVNFDDPPQVVLMPYQAVASLSARTSPSPPNLLSMASICYRYFTEHLGLLFGVIRCGLDYVPANIGSFRQ